MLNLDSMLVGRNDDLIRSWELFSFPITPRERDYLVSKTIKHIIDASPVDDLRDHYNFNNNSWKFGNWCCTDEIFHLAIAEIARINDDIDEAIVDER